MGHGVIYRCLHDNHRLAHARSTGSLAAVRLPPVPPGTTSASSASPYAAWRAGEDAGDCVESAVTAVSGLSLAAGGDRGIKSVLSVSASAQGLGDSGCEADTLSRTSPVRPPS